MLRYNSCTLPANNFWTKRPMFVKVVINYVSQDSILKLLLLLLLLLLFLLLYLDGLGYLAYSHSKLCLELWTLQTVGRTPWTGDQNFAKPLPTQDKTNTEQTQISVPRMRFEPTIPVFEQAKLYRSLSRATTVIGPIPKWFSLSLTYSFWSVTLVNYYKMILFNSLSSTIYVGHAVV
jgi:hypothetical protein